MRKLRVSDILWLIPLGIFLGLGIILPIDEQYNLFRFSIEARGGLALFAISSELAAGFILAGFVWREERQRRLPR